MLGYIQVHYYVEVIHVFISLVEGSEHYLVAVSIALASVFLTVIAIIILIMILILRICHKKVLYIMLSLTKCFVIMIICQLSSVRIQDLAILRYPLISML